MDGKKPKVQQKKVWKPKDVHRKEHKYSEESKDLHVEVEKELSFEKVNSKKEGHDLQLENTMLEQRIDDLADLSKQIVIYQRMEDRWGDLDDKIVLEEGEILDEVKNKAVEGDLLIS